MSMRLLAVGVVVVHILTMTNRHIIRWTGAMSTRATMHQTQTVDPKLLLNTK